MFAYARASSTLARQLSGRLSTATTTADTTARQYGTATAATTTTKRREQASRRSGRETREHPERESLLHWFNMAVTGDA